MLDEPDGPRAATAALEEALALARECSARALCERIAAALAGPLA